MDRLKLNGARAVMLTLLAGFLALMVAGPGTMILIAVAPPSVNLLGKIICPIGTRMSARWVRYTYSRPGQSNFEIQCNSEDGGVTSENTWWFAKLFGFYFVLLLIPVFSLSFFREATPHATSTG